jgi:hypothetical protein
MRKTLIFLIIFLGSSTIYCQAQCITSKNGAEVLTTFYKVYNIAWSTFNGDILVKKLDSLKKIYCSIKLKRQLDDEFKHTGLDHDMLIKDQYTDVRHLKSLVIKNDLKRANKYIVTYTASTVSASNKPIDVQVIIHVTLCRENGCLKIASVE